MERCEFSEICIPCYAGVSFLETGQLVEAEKCLERALRIKPVHVYAHVHMARVQREGRRCVGEGMGRASTVAGSGERGRESAGRVVVIARVLCLGVHFVQCSRGPRESRGACKDLFADIGALEGERARLLDEGLGEGHGSLGGGEAEVTGEDRLGVGCRDADEGFVGFAPALLELLRVAAGEGRHGPVVDREGEEGVLGFVAGDGGVDATEGIGGGVGRLVGGDEGGVGFADAADSGVVVRHLAHGARAGLGAFDGGFPGTEGEGEGRDGVGVADFVPRGTHGRTGHHRRRAMVQELVAKVEEGRYRRALEVSCAGEVGAECVEVGGELRGKEPGQGAATGSRGRICTRSRVRRRPSRGHMYCRLRG